MIEHLDSWASKGKWKPYPEYKDSGIEWLGRIPEHWKTARVVDHVDIISGYPFDSERFDLFEGFPLIRIRDLMSNGTSVFYNGEIVSEVLIKSGDIIISMDGDFNVARWKGEDAMLNQRLCCIRPQNTLEKGFLYYFLEFPLRMINEITYSTTVKHLSSDDVKKIKFYLPPFHEQTAIASFLDHEIVKIDALVKKKEKFIQLLEEKRTDLISQAVTKGLDPNVPMKDSGVEWLGEIPEHWKSLKFRRVCRIQQGLQMAQSKRFYEPGPKRYEYITVKSFNAGDDYGSKEYVENPSKRVICDPEDILLARTGATGEVISGLHGVFHNNFFKINYDRERVNRLYLIYYLSSTLIKEYLLLLAGTTTVPDLNHGDFLDTPFTAPDNDEQKKIIIYLDQKTEKIDNLILKINKAIEKLKEYRSALINAAVTGKIDVRGDAS